METSRGDGPSGVGSTVQSHYDWSTTRPSHAIVDAVATVEDTTPIDLAHERGIALYDHVDPEALDAIVGGDRDSTVSVTFDIDHVQVTIETSGRLVVDVDTE
ncbi:HalOD1 output domain-containing protein [Halosolutus amylolyticus]|uniref:HalOD1 output domain-containing protein n=1 Tax=Halosolutus amylolyticus TaxID=2932267 RepID=A0ABD5PP04_9EURY|nr:HalOD1 output domain-containing protein [Halosolutus amylolyticus]